MPAPPLHKLDLYRLSVQHPLAEVAFIEHAWSHHAPRAYEPMLLREDFAGTCAVAAAWCASDPDRQAMAIERDAQTAAWAARRFDDADLHIVEADVMAVDGPAVDVTVALNFSALIYHRRDELLAYLTHARRSLNPGGLLILDLFGGPGVERASTQSRMIEPDEAGTAPFTYRWEQRAPDPTSRRIDCRIHFETRAGAVRNAFVYDWRLWSAGELVSAAREAGFTDAALWWAPPGSGRRFKPIAALPEAEHWVGYVVCRCPGSADAC